MISGLTYEKDENMDIRKRISELGDELIHLRRDFHQYPELGFQEFRSQEKVMEYLTNAGLSPKKIAKTGVVALIEGGSKGKTVMLRSDMDALPVMEETGLPFSSKNEGLMHACGHDGHMAMLLVAAKILNEHRSSLKGNVKIVFQPNEEDAGAYKLVEEKVMENPKVDAVFGIHLWSQTPSGDIDIVDGPQMAASHYFFLKVKGVGGHAGFVHESVDPIIAATAIVQAAQAIQTREIDALDPAVIMFTEFRAGSNMTIVPEEVSLKGSIRFLYEGGEEIRDRFRRIVEHVAEAYRVEVELEFQVGNHLLSNNPAMAQTMREVASEVLGDPQRVTQLRRTMAGEDFSDYLVHAPGAFAFVGINNPKTKSDYPHHHPKFTIDEGSLPIGVELHVKTALKLLS